MTKGSKFKAKTEFRQGFKRHVADLPNSSNIHFVSSAGHTVKNTSNSALLPELSLPPLAPPAIPISSLESLIESDDIEESSGDMPEIKQTQVSTLYHAIGIY